MFRFSPNYIQAGCNILEHDSIMFRRDPLRYALATFGCRIGSGSQVMKGSRRRLALPSSS